MKEVDIKKETVEAVEPVKAPVIKKPTLKAYKANAPVNVRFEPSKSSKIVALVREGEVIEALEEKDGWIRYVHGWTKKEFYTEV